LGLRITTGTFKGRVLKTPPPTITRPTQERVRQAIFNMIQHSIEGAVFADLFSGSGAMGFEAISRGAEHAYLVESHLRAVKVIQENIRVLGCEDKITILKGDVKRMSTHLPLCDIIFCDPPYGSESEDLFLLEKLPVQSILKPDGVIFFETTHAFTGDALLHLTLKESRSFGDTTINVLTHKE